VAITPVDLSGYATNTYVNSVANTANSAYWYGTTAYSTANTAYSTANSAYSLANSAYYSGNGKVVATALGPVMGDGGWQMVGGVCVTGVTYPYWYYMPTNPCPQGSGFMQTQFPGQTPP
jgi:hypothetical protein